MIETASFEEVTQIRMSREIGGKPVYWVAAYLVDGLLIDTGCSFTAAELAAFLDGRPFRQVVNTHFHEDHIGGNRLLQEKFGVEILAPADSVPLIAREAKALEKNGRGVPEIIRELFSGEHAFAALSNGQYTTENLVRSVLKMGI